MRIGRPIYCGKYCRLMALLLSAATVQAAALSPGGSVTATDLTTPPNLPVLESVTSNLFVSGDGLIGTMIEEVLQESTGALDFTYQAAITYPNLVLSGVAITDFRGYTTDVEVSGPAKYTITTIRTQAGDEVAFFVAMSSVANPPLLIVRTNATSFQVGGSFSTDVGTTLAPTPVPEPASLDTLAAALALALLGSLKITRNCWRA